MVAITGEVKVYHIEYDGYYNMSMHDKQENALRRWFDNYKIDRNGRFASDYEWCVVKEVSSTSKRGGKRYLCEIGEDGTENTWNNREYVIDHTAPEPPVMTFAAKIKYAPAPPLDSAEILREREYQRMYERNPLRGYSQEYMGINMNSDLIFNANGTLAGPSPGDMLDSMRMAIEASMRIPAIRVMDYPSNFYPGPPKTLDIKPASPPLPPKHRRNV